MTLGMILDLCGGSGSWSRPYREAGYRVEVLDVKTSGDLRLSSVDVGWPVHGILAAPPCTVFAASGARWERSTEEMLEGLSVVDACLRFVAMCRPKWWALENPVGTLYRWLGSPRLIFQPNEYGDAYTKKTCIWGEFSLPRMQWVEPTEGSKMWSQYGGRSDATKTARSVTPEGFARAFFEANP